MAKTKKETREATRLLIGKAIKKAAGRMAVKMREKMARDYHEQKRAAADKWLAQTRAWAWSHGEGGEMTLRRTKRQM